jgi:hypothetical protein
VTIRQGEAYLRAELKVRIQSPPAKSRLRTQSRFGMPASAASVRTLAAKYASCTFSWTVTSSSSGENPATAIVRRLDIVTGLLDIVRGVAERRAVDAGRRIKHASQTIKHPGTGLAKSAKPAKPVRMRSGLLRTSLRFLTWVCVGLLGLLSLLPAEDIVRTGLTGPLEHFAAYAGAGAIAMAGYGLNRGAVP